MSNAVHGPLLPMHYSMTDLSWEFLKEWRINSGHQEILCLTYRFIVHVVPMPCTRSTAYSSSHWGVFCFCNASVSITFFCWSEIPFIPICTDCPSNVINKVIVSLLHEETRPFVWDSFLFSMFLSSTGMRVDISLISKSQMNPLNYSLPSSSL